VPLFDKIQNYKHFYFFKNPLALGDTLKRLQTKYQRYKQTYYLDGKREQWQLYDKLFDVDFTIDNCKYKYVIDLSFTFLHWKLAEDMMNQPNFSLNEIDNSQIELLVYNIFPWCNTALHYAFMKQDIIK